MDKESRSSQKWAPIPNIEGESYYPEVLKNQLQIHIMHHRTGVTTAYGVGKVKNIIGWKCKKCKYYLACNKIVEKYNLKEKNIIEAIKDWNLKQIYECCE